MLAPLQAHALWIAALCFLNLIFAGEALEIKVDPLLGNDSLGCNITYPCRTLAYTVQFLKPSTILLATTVFTEPCLVLSDSRGLAIIGIGAVFDCGRRSSNASGPAVRIVNSNVTLDGITFQNCVNFNMSGGTGGAVAALNSSLTVRQCIFLNNTAQSGGAVGLIQGSLRVESSIFAWNLATLKSSVVEQACSSSSATLPPPITCSSWGGAIAAVDATTLSVSSCNFTNNRVLVMLTASTNGNSAAIGGGGGLSVFYHGNVSGTKVIAQKNVFQNCSVNIMGGYNIMGGFATTTGVQYGAGFGGAVAINIGFSAASLVANDIIVQFMNNSSLYNQVSNSAGTSGYAQGGCYCFTVGSWSLQLNGNAAVDSLSLSGLWHETNGNNVSSCSAVVILNMPIGQTTGANAFGGAFSVMVGHFSFSGSSNSAVLGQCSALN